MDKKTWYTSKTIWLNIGIAIAGALSATDMGLPPEATQWIVFVGVVLNAAVRLVTNKPIGGGGK